MRASHVNKRAMPMHGRSSCMVGRRAALIIVMHTATHIRSTQPITQNPWNQCPKLKIRHVDF